MNRFPRCNIKDPKHASTGRAVHSLFQVFLCALCASVVIISPTQAQQTPPTPIPALVPSRTPSDIADEQAEQYLAQHGLDRLLAEHLERKLAGAQGGRRLEIAERLAEAYAQVLGASTSLDEQADIEGRALRLLSEVPEADSLELRLGIARAGYTRTEQTAEKWRLRLVSASEIPAVVRRLDDLTQQFANVASDANGRVQSLERQEESARTDTALINAALSGARRQRSMAHYLAAWCCYYSAELDPAGHADSAVKAMEHLGWLLGASKPGAAAGAGAAGAIPTLEKLPTELLKYEHVSRAALAMALSLSLKQQGEEAMRWLDTISQSADAPESVKSQLFTRRMLVLARTERWDALRELINSRRRPPESLDTPPTTPGATPPPRPLEVNEARLLAVLALSRNDVAPNAASSTVGCFADLAITDLLARNETGHVLDLAAQFGADRFAPSGFVGHEVRALQTYDKARKLHQAAGPIAEPTSNPEAARLYNDAADQFKLALDAPDRASFPGALANTRMLLGLCFYSAGGVPGPAGSSSLARASEWFDAAAAASVEPTRQSEALWMAIRSLDLHIARAGASSTAEKGTAPPGARRDELIDRYISTFPGTERASALLVRRAAAKAAPSSEEINRLLAVPESDPQYLTSRRQAARMAWQLYRAGVNGPPTTRDALAARYLQVAEPLLAMEKRRAAEDPTAASSAAAHTRQILDAILSSTLPDADRAERALDVLTSLITAGLVDAGPIGAELDFRRAQIAIVRGQTTLASGLITSLRTKDEKLAAAGDRMLFRAAQSEFKRLTAAAARAGATDTDRAAAVEAAKEGISHARALLRAESAGASGAADRLGDPQSLALHAGAAEMAAYLWTSASDASSRDLALALYRVLLRAQPRNRIYLRGMADMAEAAGELRDARDAWGTIVSALDPGTDAWFEAKYRLFRVLAPLDTREATELMTQHVLLYPSYGPEPWGSKIKAIDEQLNGRGSAPDPGSPKKSPGGSR